MVNLIEDHRVDFGVEPMCKLLPIAPSTYYYRIAIGRDPDLASDRAKSDQANRKNILDTWEDNHSVYGVKKVWHAVRRQGKDIARCTVERLMKQMGIQGVVHGKKVITTNLDTSQACPDDKVNRVFKAGAPNQLWVSDFTYVSTWVGMIYVAFVIDVFTRKIVGWRALRSMTTEFVLDALNQAIFQRYPVEANKLIHHSDRHYR